MADFTKYPIFDKEDFNDLNTLVAKNWQWSAFLLRWRKDLFNELKDIYSRVEKHYIDLPYHNIGHALTKTNASLMIAQKLWQEELLPLLIDEWMRHDAGFHKDHTSLGFKSKEEYSNDLYLKDASERSLWDGRIALTSLGILATDLTSRDFDSEMQKISRASDTRWLWAKREVFFTNSKNLIKETNMISWQEPIWIEEFVATSVPFLESLLSLENVLTEKYFHIPWWFYQQFKVNLENLKNQPLLTR